MLSRLRARDSEPGTRFAYSNTGYFLLGQAVERATGRRLGAMLRPGRRDRCAQGSGI